MEKKGCISKGRISKGCISKGRISKGRISKGLTFWLVCVAVAVGAFGCVTGSVGNKSAADAGAVVQNVPPAHKYHEFADVLIPAELKPQPKKSSIYQAPGFSAGLSVLEGNVDSNSLVGFFEVNMAKDNWKHLGTMKYKPSLLLFEKHGRACVIRIEESSFKTTVEIWVAPTSKESLSE